jgi:hypothetical protein
MSFAENRALRTLWVAACVLLCAQPAMAEMSRSAFSGAQEAARLMGRMAAALEGCQVVSSRITTRVTQKAESCHASSQQIDRLQSLIDDEISKGSSSQCTYGSQAAAERVLTETIRKLDANIKEGNCD